jgi:hypothetical protein
MYTLFNNNTNTTGVPEYPEIPDWQVWLCGGALVAMMCLACCVYECRRRVMRHQELAWFRAVGLLEPLNPPDIELPSMAEETGSMSSMVSSVAPSPRAV